MSSSDESETDELQESGADSRSENEEDNDSTESDVTPRLVLELLSNDRAYSEKMALIGREIYRTALPRAHRGGYKDPLQDLDSELFHDTGISGTDLAKMVGYPSFRAMCLNAPEIVENFTWKRDYKEYCGRIWFEIYNFCPIISERHKLTFEMQKIGLQETSNNPIEKFVTEHRNRGDFPEDRELKFRFRLCETLEQIDGRNRFVHLSELQKSHERIHKEKLNSETYRRHIPFKTDINVQRIIKERFHMEISARPNVSKTNLEFQLRHTLDFIDQCYNALSLAREDYKRFMARPRPQNGSDEDEGDYGRIKLRFQR